MSPREEAPQHCPECGLGNRQHTVNCGRGAHDPIQHDGYCHCLAPAHRCDYPRCPAGRAGEPEPSCNGSLQESKKLTGGELEATPRTEAALGRTDGDYYLSGYVDADFARQLERELNEAMATLETVSQWNAVSHARREYD
jgi:hypothetical protein